MSEKNLKSEQYYHDRYDRLTVAWMRAKEKFFDESDIKSTGDEAVDKLKTTTRNTVKEMALYFEKGEQYLNKRKTIQEWMSDDERKDKLMESANEPTGIGCLFCNKEMTLELKTLHSGKLGSDEKVLFMFRCQLCRKGRAFFHTGEEWMPKPDYCETCGSVLRRHDDRTENRINTYYHCPKHGLVKTDGMDLNTKDEEIDPDYETDRARFCISEQEGQDYFSFKINMNHFQETLAKMEEKEARKEEHDKVAQIKKINIVELENILSSELEKIGYVKFELKSPETGRHFIVPFNVRDSKSDRRERDSQKQLEKAIKDALKDTNWRLMTNGIHYRLGFLEGSLKAYEKDEDLLKLV